MWDIKKSDLALQFLRKHAAIVVEDVRARFLIGIHLAELDPPDIEYSLDLAHEVYSAITLAREFASHEGRLATIPNMKIVAERVAAEGISTEEPEPVILIVALYLLQPDENILNQDDERFVSVLIEEIEESPPPQASGRLAK